MANALFPYKADVWIDGELKAQPCSIEEVAEKPIYKKDSIGLKQDTGHTELMFRIKYPRNFKVQEQWIPTNRLRKTTTPKEG